MKYRVKLGYGPSPTGERNLTQSETKLKRQADAELRKYDREQRSNQEQLTKLDADGHVAKKERARLNG
tara:strand:- start:1336 stop:1539 length:204 start_codon:yes stop_codon:yes gene_type:complete